MGWVLCACLFCLPCMLYCPLVPRPMRLGAVRAFQLQFHTIIFSPFARTFAFLPPILHLLPPHLPPSTPSSNTAPPVRRGLAPHRDTCSVVPTFHLPRVSSPYNQARMVTRSFSPRPYPPFSLYSFSSYQLCD
ncbi:hypothetical protein C8R47DRAFT_1158433 [Mycena vitilis]|nr:hypothetical protein C8R47DRAFT_1158433 [Mycena vitilis]